MLPSGNEDTVSVATSEVGPVVTEGSSKDWPIIVGVPIHKGETHTPTDVAFANGAVLEGLVDEVATANWAGTALSGPY